MREDLWDFVKADKGNTTSAVLLSLRCPHCRHQGAFHGAPGLVDLYWLRFGEISQEHFRAAGLRICPNPTCNRLVFAVYTGLEVLQAFPPEIIDYDSANIPPAINATLEEAIACHAAGAYRACALMVRRALEEICSDRGAKGKDLKARIEALSKTITVPAALLEAADELRILGNDAAHVEAREYDAIGEVEAGLAIDLAKELLKATYQMANLVDRLRALKRPAEDAG